MQQSEALARLGRIELQEAKALLDEGRALFIDVRPPDAYEHQRIPGAISIPLQDLGVRVGSLPAAHRFVLYCT
jgi:rhodanese-related sulfurtransferase